ncbi:MAG: glycosyl transferase [Cyclobacteriaceae bacterium]
MRKVLIITYYWPPSGGVGVQRWLKFSKYLPENGWQPIVYTPENPDFDLVDNSLINEVAPEVIVIKKNIVEPFSVYKNLFGKRGASTRQGLVAEQHKTSLLQRLTIWIRGNLFIPDPRITWVKPSINFLKAYLKKNPVDLVVTTGPPHSMHLIGLGIKEFSNVKWVADFRDPWSDWDVLPRLKVSAWALKKHRRLEQSVFEACDLLLTVSPRLAAKYQAKTSLARFVTNGYDGASSININTLPAKFRISHVGLLNETRNAENLWKALNELVGEIPGFLEDLEIVLAGSVSQFIVDSLKQMSIGNCLINKDYIPHGEVFKLYEKSYLLLLLLNKTDNSSWILPGKLFEYLQTGKTILAIGEPDGDANDLLQEQERDTFVAFDDFEGIKQQVAAAYSAFKKGEVPQPSSKSEKYSRKKLTKKLSIILEELMGKDD